MVRLPLDFVREGSPLSYHRDARVAERLVAALLRPGNLLYRLSVVVLYRLNTIPEREGVRIIIIIIISIRHQ